MTKLLLSSVLLATIVHATENVSTERLTASTKDSGWYVGANIGLLNFGGEVMIDNGYNEETYDVDTEDKPMILKVGYVTESENRIELYFKNDSIEAEEQGTHIDMYDTSTFGINYQWGISSLSTNEMLPYIRVGIGFGSAELEGKTVDFDAIDFDLGLGVHYQVTPNIDLSGGIYRRAVGINSESSDTIIISAVNGIEIGANYHF